VLWLEIAIEGARADKLSVGSMNPPSRSMPPPPAIGAVRPPKGTKAAGAEGDPNGEMPQTASDANGDRAAEPPERASHAEGERLEESATQRWPSLNAEIREDDGPSEEVGSRSLPVAAMRPLAPPPPSVSASSTSSLRAPDASSTSGFLRVPSLGPTASDSAASWPKTDGWDLDDAAPEGGGAGKAETHAPRPGAAAKPGATKEVGSIPSVPRPPGGPIPSVPKPGAAKEVGSVPSVPKTGAGTKVGPLPKLGGARPAHAPKHGGAAEDASARPLFGTMPSPGSLASSPSASGGEATDASSESPLDAWASFSTPSLDAASVDASAPPSSASPLDALPSFDAPPPGGAPEDGVPSMDSNALLGVALAPVTPFELAPLGDEDAAAEPAPSVPRLPMPGMLRDGLAPAADFRATPRTPRSPQPPPAMATPRGMVPPKLREGEEPRLKPGDTQALVAQVAEELMEQVDRQRAEKAAAEKATDEPRPEHDREAAMAIAAATAAPPQLAPRPAAAGVVPTASPYLSTREAETKRRTKILGIGAIGVVAAIGLLVWMNAGEREEAPTQTAASTVSPAPQAPAPQQPADAKVEPPDPSPVPVADEADAGAEPSDPVEPDPAAEAGAGDPAEAADEAGAEPTETPTDPEPTEAASEPTGSSRKSSGKKSGGKTSSAGSDTKEEPAPKPEPKPEEGQSAAKLLKQARSAYNAGKGSTAYSLASKSNRMEPSGEAAEVMALAACQMKDADKAKSALKTVPLFSRGTVRSTCKTKHGVKLGL
jgi:hypothetical protein